MVEGGSGGVGQTAGPCKSRSGEASGWTLAELGTGSGGESPMPSVALDKSPCGLNRLEVARPCGTEREPVLVGMERGKSRPARPSQAAVLAWP